MTRKLGHEGADPQTSGNFYKAVLQETLLFRAYNWEMPTRIWRNLGVFRHRVAHFLENMKPRRDMTRRCVYIALYKAMMAVGLEEVEMYILHFQNTTNQYISTCSILELYMTVD